MKIELNVDKPTTSRNIKASKRFTCDHNFRDCDESLKLCIMYCWGSLTLAEMGFAMSNTMIVPSLSTNLQMFSSKNTNTAFGKIFPSMMFRVIYISSKLQGFGRIDADEFEEK